MSDIDDDAHFIGLYRTFTLEKRLNFVLKETPLVSPSPVVSFIEQ